MRALGGTSSIWGGRCIPLDPIDFERRAWVPESGWPLDYATLHPYYLRAMGCAEAGAYLFDPRQALPGEQAELAPNLDGEIFRTTIERFSKPTNFWRLYGSELSRSAGVRLAINAAVKAIRLGPDGRKVDHLEVVRPDGHATKVRANCYVLALGALETTRLLLASNEQNPAGVGNDHDHLGRYYMSHLCATEGVVTFSGAPSAIAHDYQRDPDGVYLRRRLWTTEQAQREHQLLNTTIRTHLPEPADPSHNDAILSAMFLVKDLVLYEYSRRFSENPVTLGARIKHVLNVMNQPARLGGFGAGWMKDRVFADRKRPSVVLGSKLNRYVLEFHAEQAPNPDSRLTLSEERDAHGVPRLRVDWRYLPIDIESLQKVYGLLDQELQRSGAGQLSYDPQRLAERAERHGVVGGHQIGTTRMSAEPQDGVVDPHCRVHGLENLYVASNSVFPTSGQANPTLTLLALTLRLADHLAGQLLAA